MNRNRFTQGRPLWILLSLAGLLAPAASGWADTEIPGTSRKPDASAPETRSPGASTEMAKPVPPNKSELADSAFKKLDPNGKGYVAKEDTRGLEGFDRIFDKVDSKHTGKLDQAQFKKAWKQYAAEKNPASGKAAW